MIIMGAGTNHWFHSDTIYRTFLTLTNLCATQGVNGGGWAHYVGQEKVRPITGWMHLANALDRSEEHTSELQSRGHLVCRLLLEKKNKENYKKYTLNFTILLFC